MTDGTSGAADTSPRAAQEAETTRGRNATARGPSLGLLVTAFRGGRHAQEDAALAVDDAPVDHFLEADLGRHLAAAGDGVLQPPVPHISG